MIGSANEWGGVYLDGLMVIHAGPWHLVLSADII